MFKVNLAPEIQQERIRVKRINFLATIISVVIGGLLFLVLFVLLGADALWTGQRNKVQHDIDSVNAELNSDEFKQLADTVISLQNSLSSIDQLIKNRPSWRRFFEYLESATPQDIQINSITISDNGQLNMQLTGYSPDSVGRFIKAFQDFQVPLLDNNGNTKKDDKGNDITTKVFKDVDVPGYSKGSGVSFTAKMTFDKEILNEPQKQ